MNETDDILHDESGKRFYFEHRGLVAELRYEILENGTLDFYRTFVPEELRGGGLAGDLVLTASVYAREAKKLIKPSCSFVDSWFKRHKEFGELIDESLPNNPSCRL